LIPDAQNPEKIPQQNQQASEALSGDGSPAFIVRNSNWIACNEIPHKLDHRGNAIGFVMRIEQTIDIMPADPKLSEQVVRSAWFGRVRDERGDWSFGPATLGRAQQAVEAYLRHEDFTKNETEKSWRGDAWDLVTGGKLSDWTQCVDCGKRVRVMVPPPRCSACYNRAKSRQLALEQKFKGRMGEAPPEAQYVSQVVKR
jgi:hypothetical protein